MNFILKNTESDSADSHHQEPIQHGSLVLTETVEECTVKLGISAFLKICNHHILWSEKVPWDILRIAVTIINYHKMGSKKILAFFFKTISSSVWFHSFQYGGSKNQSVLTAVQSAAAAVEQCASNRRRPSVLLVVLPIRDSNQKCIQQT